MQCKTKVHRRKLTMNWEGLEDDDDDNFFEARERISSVAPPDVASSSDADDFEDSRMSFASTISSASTVSNVSVDSKANAAISMMGGYDMWRAEPGDVKERRKRLLQGMGLASTKSMLRMASTKIARTVSRKRNNGRVSTPQVAPSPPPVAVVSAPNVDSSPANKKPLSLPSHPYPTAKVLGRSRSESDIDFFSCRYCFHLQWTGPLGCGIWKQSAERQVVDWTDAREMVTAASYTPDGQGAVIGSHQGICRFYSIDDYKLEHNKDIQMKTKAQSKKIPGLNPQLQAKKITGFQYTPWNPSEVLITSTDSRIRIYNGEDVIQKFRGFRNTSSQIAASFSPNGKYVISASEDSQVYIWKVAESKIPSGGKKNKITVQAYEHFNCKGLTVAIAWPGSMTSEPPIVKIHSKRHSKRSISLHPYVSKDFSTHEDSAVGASKRRILPPLPKKHEYDDNAHSPSIDPGIGVNSSSVSNRELSSNSPSQSDNGYGHGGNIVQATAWGMVIITASFEGEIKVHQNFGLPWG